MKAFIKLGVAALATFWATGSGLAQAPGGGASGGVATQLAPAQRNTLVRELIAKFQNEVARTPKGDVAAWSSKLSKVAATANAGNLLRATTMPTLQSMHAALNGAVLKTETLSALARTAGAPAAESDGAVVARLGSVISDTTYTPLPHGRCRIADSRVISSPLTANVERSIDVEDISSYAAQGGPGTYANGDGSTNCGIPSFATAYVVAVLLIQPTGNAQLKIYANGDPKFEGNTVLTNTGKFASNEMIVESCQSCAEELAVLSNTQTHYVIDIMGYFMPPEATPLECVNTAETTATIAANGTADVTAPACDPGYTTTATNCTSSSWYTPFVWFKNGTCSSRNLAASANDIRASRTCCRVPGR